MRDREPNPLTNYEPNFDAHYTDEATEFTEHDFDKTLAYFQNKVQCVAIVHGVRCERMAVHFPSFIEQYTASSIDGSFTRIASCSPLCEACYQMVIESTRRPDRMRFDPAQWEQTGSHSWQMKTPGYVRRRSKHKRLWAVIYKHHRAKVQE